MGVAESLSFKDNSEVCGLRNWQVRSDVCRGKLGRDEIRFAVLYLRY